MSNLRSPFSARKIFVRFWNKSYRQINIFWLDFEGNPKQYNTLLPNQFVDIDTYEGHLWTFEDIITGEGMHVVGKPIFAANYNLARLPQDPERRQHCRLCVPIFLPMLNLRQIALRAVYTSLRDFSLIDRLELPKELRNELQKYGDIRSN